MGRWLGAYVGGCCLARMVRQEQIHIYHHLLGGRQTAGLEVPKGVGSTKTYAAKPTCLTHKITWPHMAPQERPALHFSNESRSWEELWVVDNM